MKHYIKKDENNPNKCIEPCPFRNEKLDKDRWEFNGLMIGSGACQQCEHHIINNKTEVNPKHKITEGGVVWLKCNKLKS